MGSSKYKLTRHKKNGVNAYPKTLVEAVFWDKEKKPLEEVLDGLESVAEKVPGKIDAPVAAGSAGQVLSLDANGKSAWVDAATGGTYDGALSDSSTNAPQNKVVTAKLSELGHEVDDFKSKVLPLAETDAAGFWLETNGTFSTGNKYGYFIKVVGGQSYSISAPSTNSVIFAVLKSIPSANGDSADYATGETRHALSAYGTYSGTFASDAEYLYVSKSLNNTPFDPESLIINGYNLVYGIPGLAKDINSIAREVLKNNQVATEELFGIDKDAPIAAYSAISGVYPNYADKRIYSVGPAYTTSIYDVSARDNIAITWEHANTTLWSYLLIDDPTLADLSGAIWLPYAADHGERVIATQGKLYLALITSSTNYPNCGAAYDTIHNIAALQENIETIGIPSDKYTNITEGSHTITTGGTGMTITDNADGSITFSLALGSAPSAGSWFWFGFPTGTKWIYNHKYFVAVDALVTSDSQLAAGQKRGLQVILKDGWSDIVNISGSVEFDLLPVGTRSSYRGVEVAVRNTYPDAQNFVIQFGRYTNADSFNITIYGICVIDLGLDGDTISYAEASAYYDAYGVKDGKDFPSAKVAELALEVKNKRNIDIWGDSLTAADWGRFLQEKTQRLVTGHGYGGRTSNYIRDQFLAGYNRDNLSIIWVGRNNYGKWESVIDDIRMMVAALDGAPFLIMTPPNGGVVAELEGESAYTYFERITKSIVSEYPGNYVDIREAIVRGWDCGGVRLVSPYTQPAVGSNVQVEVTDASFLVNINSNDLSVFGSSIMNKVVIGINGQYDEYDIVSKDDDTHITLKLAAANRITPGSSVENPIDPNDPGSGAIEYLRVMQNGDHYCIENDTTPSTSRIDMIHQTDRAKEYTARVVARVLSAMNL